MQSIFQRDVSFQEDDFYKVKYPRGACYPPHVVVQRAQEGIDVENYSLLFGNCEHFAVHCKTGQWESQQVKVNCKSPQTDVLQELRNGPLIILAGAKQRFWFHLFVFSYMLLTNFSPDMGHSIFFPTFARPLPRIIALKMQLDVSSEPTLWLTHVISIITSRVQCLCVCLYFSVLMDEP